MMTRYKFESLSFYLPDKAVQWLEVDRRLTRKKQEGVPLESMEINEKDTAAHLSYASILGDYSPRNSLRR